MRAFRQRRKPICNLMNPDNYLFSRRVNSARVCPPDLDRLWHLGVLAVPALLLALGGPHFLALLSGRLLQEGRAALDPLSSPEDQVDPDRPWGLVPLDHTQ